MKLWVGILKGHVFPTGLSANRLPRDNTWIRGLEERFEQSEAVSTEKTGLGHVMWETERGSQTQLHVRITGVALKTSQSTDHIHVSKIRITEVGIQAWVFLRPTLKMPLCSQGWETLTYNLPSPYTSHRLIIFCLHWVWSSAIQLAKDQGGWLPSSVESGIWCQKWSCNFQLGYTPDVRPEQEVILWLWTSASSL